MLRYLRGSVARSRVRAYLDVSAESGRFGFHYPLNLFRKLVDSTRTIYNIPTAICSSMEMATYYFGFTCNFLAICLVGAGYQLSACCLPAICLFRAGYLLFACLFGLSSFVYIDTRLCHLR